MTGQVRWENGAGPGSEMTMVVGVAAAGGGHGFASHLLGWTWTTGTEREVVGGVGGCPIGAGAHGPEREAVLR